VLLDTLDVYTWGDKENGVSGHGDTEGHQYTPRIVDTLKAHQVRQIAACGFHTAALAQNGDVFTWGEGKFGRLGHGVERNQLTPRLIEDLHGTCVRQVTCGGFHTAAITDTGELYTWGGGEHGQLGHGDKVNKTSPCLVEALRDKLLVQITCGWSHTVALTDTGDVYTWGNGDHGKLGHGDTMKVTVPRLVEALLGKHVCRVASYNEHTASLTDPGGIPKTSLLTSSFLGDLRRLINNSDFSDVTFVVEDKPVHAHRAFLAVRCDHFRAMFSSGMKESRELEIPIPNIRFPIFMALVEYIYTDVVADISPEVAIELYIAADLYTLDRLKGLCEVVVQRGLTTDNAPVLLQGSDERHAARMRELCIRFIVRHFDAVTKSAGFQTLSRELILEVLQAR
jgi:RCC1 and BTB domain-containing protein